MSEWKHILRSPLHAVASEPTTKKKKIEKKLFKKYLTLKEIVLTEEQGCDCNENNLCKKLHDCIKRVWNLLQIFFLILICGLYTKLFV